ncbi:MAG: DUF4743 domain-containing protein, partial [Alphaproteobacteria bacterium]|nr:DUF4743 domain-containing protein [Alphaproteobacteria bacterium]
MPDDNRVREPALQRHFDQCNRYNPGDYTPFLIGGSRYGWLRHEHAKLLATCLPDDYQTLPDGSVTLASSWDDFKTRSAAIARGTDQLLTSISCKLRHEMYAVQHDWPDVPVAEVDRSVIPWFGFRAFGVHVNGYVHKPDGLYLWVGERAMDRQASPGKLDNLVGGGMPIGITPTENLCKEAFEEAAIPRELALTARPAPSISYKVARHDGLRNDTLLIYDLELPESFTPHNTDGEVAAFHLMPIAEVLHIIRTTDRFKFNCNLVIIEFAERM